MGGGMVVGYQQRTTGPALNAGDENMHLLTKNLSLKQASITSISSSNSMTTNIQTLESAASITSLQNGLTQAQQTILNRNALGDIGNKLTNKGLPVIANKLVQLSEKLVISAEPSGNNSCVMEEEEVEEEDNVMAEESIVDIDEFDSDNTQLASEYVKDIYKYLSQVEKEYRISAHFLDNKIVTTKMRAVLVDWLIQVHLKFHLLQETLYLCVQIIDAYLMAQDVPKMQLQLVGVTAMFVASKYEEMYVPAIDDFVYMTDNTYTKAEIRQMEISILKTLNFMFCKPLPLHFLRRFSKAGQVRIYLFFFKIFYAKLLLQSYILKNTLLTLIFIEIIVGASYLFIYLSIKPAIRRYVI
jgi:hypothetical protein